MDDNPIKIDRWTDTGPVNGEIMHLRLAAQYLGRFLLGGSQQIVMKTLTVEE